MSSSGGSSSAIWGGNAWVAKRNGYGVRGEPIDLLTNLYRIAVANDGEKERRYRKYTVEVGVKKKVPVRPSRGRGRGRGGGGGEVRNDPLKKREDRRRVFWFLVSLRPDVFKSEWNLVYDDFDTAWANDAIRPPDAAYIFEFDALMEESLLLPESGKEGKEVRVYIKIEHTSVDVSLKDGSEEAGMFSKALFLQQLRIPLDVLKTEQNSPHCNTVRTMCESFTAYANCLFRIPRNRSYPNYDVYIAPYVKQWIGLYASLRSIEDYNPVINFGLVNHLFLEMDIDLPTYWAELVNEAFGGTQSTVGTNFMESELRRRELEEYSMDRRQRAKFNEHMKGFKVKGKKVIVQDFEAGGERFFVALRHYKFLCLCEPERNPLTEFDDGKVGEMRGGGRGGRGGGRGGGGRGRGRGQGLSAAPQPRQRRLEQFEFHWTDRGFGHTARQMRVRVGHRECTLEQLYGELIEPLRFPNLPLCEVQTANRINFVPMEMLFTHDTPQAYKKMLNFETRMRYIRAATRPADRHLQITNAMVKKLEFDENPFLREFGVSVDPRNIECKGRVINAPSIQSKSAEPLVPLKEDHRGFSLKSFLTAPPKKIHFAIIIVQEGREGEGEGVAKEDIIQKFFNRLVCVCRERGMDVHDEVLQVVKWFPQRADSLKNVERHISGVFQKEKTAKNDLLAVLVFSRRDLELYGEVKAVMNERGIASQIINASTLLKAAQYKEDGIYYHLSMKLNAKLGGVTHALSAALGDEKRSRDEDSGLLFLAKNHPTMFMGIDVTHPTANSGIEGISLASIVGSIDLAATRYTTQVIAQMRPKETILNFDKGQFSEIMRSFIKNADKRPRHIVILRDGVSDGELMSTASVELRWIQKTLQDGLYDSSIALKEQVSLTYIVVQKRHHLRFYPKGGRGADGEAGNVPSGTSVDSAVVHPFLYDFYLTSHYGAIGTSRPCRYIVMYDEWNLGPDQMQEMMYNLCFLYSRCAHPVSLPAPLYYAHLVCEQAKEVYKQLVREGTVQARNTPVEERFVEEENREQFKIERLLQPSKEYPGMAWI